MLQSIPPDPPRYDPDHLLAYSQLHVYLKWKSNLDIPLSSLYSMNNRGTGPKPTPFRGRTMFRVRDVDEWVANGDRR
jgi:hypothetical protein